MNDSELVEHQMTSILLVDDDINDLDLIQHHLKKHFKDVLLMRAESKEQFFERLSWVKPDLIVSDYHLKDGNGLELLLHVKKNFDIPFIFVTGALDDSNLLSKSILAGADGYILKDNMETVIPTIQHIMKVDALKKHDKLARESAISKIKIKLSRSIAKLADQEHSSDVIKDLEGIRAVLNQHF